MLVILFIALCSGGVSAQNAFDWTAETVKNVLTHLPQATTKPTPVMIAESGYTCEIHNVTTDDGYYLTMHRITATPTGHIEENSPVVLLVHGLLSSSADWVVMGPEQGFAYQLANAGCDVWIGNARGNTYSQGHKFITTEREYWNFSWHEIGIYDLPAMIDHALNVTGAEKLHYIGHSQGTTAFFVMTSLLHEYNAKIVRAYCLAPAGHLGHAKSPILKALATFEDVATIATELFGSVELLPATEITAAIANIACNDEAFTQPICTNILFTLAGPSPMNLNTTALPLILGHTPAGSSTKQLVHYLQGKNSHKFRQYDYGFLSNLEKYNRSTPPPYNIRSITVAVVVFYSNNDWLVASEDVRQLYSELGNPASLNLVEDAFWNHLDFLWAQKAVKLIYNPIINEILNGSQPVSSQYNPSVPKVA